MIKQSVNVGDSPSGENLKVDMLFYAPGELSPEHKSYQVRWPGSKCTVALGTANFASAVTYAAKLFIRFQRWPFNVPELVRELMETTDPDNIGHANCVLRSQGSRVIKAIVRQEIDTAGLNALEQKKLEVELILLSLGFAQRQRVESESKYNKAVTENLHLPEAQRTQCRLGLVKKTAAAILKRKKKFNL